VRIPSLRERREDIPLFLDFFLKKYSREHGKPISGISDKSSDLLLAYDWPGNIRELENVIERAIILTEPNTSINLDMVLSPTIADTTVDAHELDRDGQLVKTADRSVLSGLADIAEHLIEQEISIEDIETAVLTRAMEKAGGKVSKAARLVGLTRPAFAYRLKKNQTSTPDTD
jgi:transcriptional regulator with AAA-type ATPase domain